MKKIYIISMLLCFYGLASARPFKGEVVVVCNALEERDDALFLDLSIDVKRLAVNKCQSWTIIPELKASPTLVKTFPPVLVNGKNKRQMYERKKKFRSRSLEAKKPFRMVNVRKDTDTTLRYTVEVPYEYWMDDAALVLRQILGSCAGREQLFTVDLAKQVRLESKVPYLVQPAVSYIEPEKELVKKRNIQAQAFLDFQVGRSVIVPEFRRNPEELAKIRQTLRSVQNDADVTITGMFIEGYASPEGSYALNTRLSNERANALMDYVADNFGVGRSMIRATATPEDWDGLRILVEESDIAHKDAILSVIDSNLEPDQKEARIKGYSSYRIMLDEMFPQLRRSDYRIDFTVKDYTVAEARTILGSDPAKLSLYELYTVAHSYEEGSPEFGNVYDIIARLYPEDETAVINTATAMYKRGEYAGAKRRLESLTDDPTALNTLGAVYLAEGDLDKAETLFLRAKALGSGDADHNLAEVRAKRADNEKLERYRNR